MVHYRMYFDAIFAGINLASLLNQVGAILNSLYENFYLPIKIYIAGLN